MDYDKNLLYFTGSKTLITIVTCILIVLGIVLMEMHVKEVIERIPGGISLSFILIQQPLIMIINWGTILIIVGFLLAKRRDKFRTWPVSDKEYDTDVLGFAKELKKSRALNKLGLDESEVKEVAPIVLYGYDFEGADKIKKGDDGKWRSNIFKLVALFSSANELHGYTMRFNTLRDAKTEGTEIFFYQDIVSVSTSSTAINAKLDGKDITVNSEAFKLTTKGGTSITVCLDDANKYQGSFKAMRALLREKKQA